MRHHVGEGRKVELAAKVEELLKKYEKAFGVILSDGDIIGIVDDMFRDAEKAFAKRILGTVTFADRDHLCLLLKTRAAVKKVEEDDRVTREGQGVSGVLREAQVEKADSKTGHKGAGKRGPGRPSASANAGDAGSV